jgi:hypothetical protein
MQVRAVSAAAITCALSGCGQAGPTMAFQALNACQVSTLGKSEVIQRAGAADLLFVIDNLGSMQDKQAALVAAFQGFSQCYLGADASGRVRDLRMASITTDTYFAGTGNKPLAWAQLTPGYHDGIFPPTAPASGSLPSPRSGKPILTSWTLDLDRAFVEGFDPSTKVEICTF